MASDVICVVQARAGSTRLPGKVLADLDGRPLLEFMLTRLHTLDVDTLVVATTDLARDDAVERVARAAGADVVRGDEVDVLDRFAKVIEAHHPTTVVRLSGDSPLMDPAVVTAAIDLHSARSADYTCNFLPRSFPKGISVEVASASALLTAHREATRSDEREHVTPFLYRHPERFRLANLWCDDDAGGVGWNVDRPEELEDVRTIVAQLDAPLLATWREILAVTGRPVRTSHGLRLRPASADDSAALLRWRNDPDAVRHSGTQRAVDPFEHERWFAARLVDPGTKLWIAEVDGVPIGTARVDVESAVGAVSVALDPAWRGRGLAPRILTGVDDEIGGDLQVLELVADVDPENEPSKRTFEAAGYRQAGRSGRMLRYVRS